MQRILALLAIAVMACLVGCVPTATELTDTTDTTTPTSTGTYDLTKPGTVISSIDFGTVTLPKSLREDTSSSTSGSKKGPRRYSSGGAVTTLTSLSLPSLKASGYNTFKELLDGDSTVVILLNALQTVPSIADGSLAYDTTIDTGTITFTISGTTLTVTDSGKFKTTLSSDANTLYCYWSMNFPNLNAADWTTSARIPIKVYFTITTDGVVSAWAYSDSTDMSMKYYSECNLATKAMKEASTSTVGSYTGKYSQVVIPNSDGSFSIYFLNESGGYAYNELGYASDSFGGVVSEFTSSSYGSNINVEYYNGSGDLVYQGYGQNASSAESNWSWMADYAGYSPLNIEDFGCTASTKPSAFQLKTTYGEATTYAWSINGTDWTTFDGSSFGGYAVVFHETESDSGSTWTLQPGDGVYWSSGWDCGTDASSNWYTVQSYYLGYEVPTAETYFGTSYYVDKSVTLKNLLPLKSAYADFAVKQQEGTTYYSWEDTSGNWTSATTAPATGSYTAGTLSSWTQYDYWLENVSYNTSTGTTANSDTTYDSDKGDVKINLSSLSVWYWDNTNGTSLSKQTAAFSTYDLDNLPPYFTVDSSMISNAASTKSKLEELYTVKSSYTAATMLSGFDSVMTSDLLAQFP